MEINFDWFKNTIVARTLGNSLLFQHKFKGKLEEIWWDPEEFLNRLSQYIWDKTQPYEMDHWILVFGYEGSGKSSLSLMLYKNILNMRNKEFGEQLDVDEHLKNDVIFMQSEYARMMYNYNKNKKLGKQHPILIDDAHYVFGKYYGLTSETQSLLQIARFGRSQQVIHVLNTQVPQQLFADIWKERVNTYIYCFSIDVVHSETQRLKTRHMYAAFYNMETSQILRSDPIIRTPLFWKKILQRYPPDMITRFDTLFYTNSDLYSSYKDIKKFYAQFYQYLRYKGITKGRHFEIIFKLLAEIAKFKFSYGSVSQMNVSNIISDFTSNLPDQTTKTLHEHLVFWKEKGSDFWILDKELLSLALNYSELLLIRDSILDEEKK